MSFLSCQKFIAKHKVVSLGSLRVPQGILALFFVDIFNKTLFFLHFQILTLFLVMGYTLVTLAIIWMQAVTDSISQLMIMTTMPFMFWKINNKTVLPETTSQKCQNPTNLSIMETFITPFLPKGNVVDQLYHPVQTWIKVPQKWRELESIEDQFLDL